jgi:hypothetical protein
MKLALGGAGAESPPEANRVPELLAYYRIVCTCLGLFSSPGHHVRGLDRHAWEET